MLTSSLLQSDIFRPRLRTRLYLKMRPPVLSKAILLSLGTLWQVRKCSVAICLILPSPSCFLSYSVSLSFCVCQTTCIHIHTHIYIHLTFSLLMLCVCVYTHIHMELLVKPEICRIYMDEIFLLGILLLEPYISLIYAWKTNKYTTYSFSLSIMYGSSYMFRHYIAIIRERS
jgi:hypothetical protein